MTLGGSKGVEMIVLGVTTGVIWPTLETTMGCSAIPTEITLLTTGACWQGGAMLLGTAVLLIVVCTGKTPEGAEQGGAWKG